MLDRIKALTGKVEVGRMLREDRVVELVFAARHGRGLGRSQAEREVASWPTGLASAALALGSKNVTMRRDAADQLRKLDRKHPAVRCALRRAAADRDAGVALTAAKSLIKTGDPKAVKPVVNSWDDDDAKKHADEVASRMEPETTDDLLNLDLGRWGGEFGLQRIICALAPRCSDQLLPRCGDRNKDVRRRATRALGFSGRANVGDTLVARLKDGDSEVRVAALESLSRLGIPREEVLMCLRDRNEVVRWRAADTLAATEVNGAYEAVLARVEVEKHEIARGVMVRSLGRMGGEQSLPVLARWISEAQGSPSYRYGTYASKNAAEAMKAMGSAGIEALYEHAYSDDPVVRCAALSQIGVLKRDARAAQALADALRVSGAHSTAWNALVGSGAEFYARFNDRPIDVVQDALLPMLDDPDPEIRARACRALMSQTLPSVAQRVARLLDEDPEREVQLAAMHTLGALGDEGTRVTLESRQSDPDEEMRAAARKALDHHKLSQSVQAAAHRRR